MKRSRSRADERRDGPRPVAAIRRDNCVLSRERLVRSATVCGAADAMGDVDSTCDTRDLYSRPELLLVTATPVVAHPAERVSAP